MKARYLHRIAALALLGGMAAAAQAHPGHGAYTLTQGLEHPLLGLDHLLAMVAVGVWSVSALAASKAWQGPATFMLALLAGASLGMMGLNPPHLELLVALSVVLFGAMLWLSRQKSAHPAAGLGLIAAAAALHGLAHGAEAPASGFAGYAIGFLVTTAMLHVSGVGIGLAIRRWLAERSGLALGGLGAAVSMAGLYLAGQLV